MIIIGIDEAGRGALAGPVVAAACCLQLSGLSAPGSKSPLIRDSKKLHVKQREEAYTWITKNCPYGIGIVDAEEIDAIRILSATEKAMNLAVEQLIRSLSPLPSHLYLLIDGRDKFWFDYSHSSIIDGDAKEPCISAASIIAKVKRDHLMCEYDRKYPSYQFAQHKGYGTAKHLACIEKHGISSLHRKTFCHVQSTREYSLPKREKVSAPAPESKKQNQKK